MNENWKLGIENFFTFGEFASPPKADPPRAGRLYIIMHYVYIIYSKKLNKKYIGYTKDLKDRLIHHNSDRSNYTSKGVQWELLYYEVFKSEKDARQEELFLKTGRGRERLKFLLKNTMKKFGEFA